MKKAQLLAAAILAAAMFSVQANGSSRPGWLNDAVFYQIYPSSFQDSDGNGIGDIPGIISRLDYIRSLGVTAIWLNPIYVSGWTDGGYDVIDFYRVDPRFGTNTDLVTLTKEAHERGIKVVLDLVAGHSSDKCEWFLQSREAENLRYSDYYIWPSFKPEDDSEGKFLDYAAMVSSKAGLLRKFVPTDAPRGPYYIKNFFDTQPALNFGFADPDPAHPWEQAVDDPGPMAMRRELKNIMAFWMDKGVDGFRVDMASSLVKNDPDKAATIALWNEDLSVWFNLEYPEGVLIAEWFNPEEATRAGFDLDFFCHEGTYNYSTLFFNTDRMSGKPKDCYFSLEGKGELRTWYDLYMKQYSAVKGEGYVCMPSGNHDFTRLAAGNRTSEDQLKIAMSFFLTMPGVPFIYYGDEIGLKNISGLPSVEGAGNRTGTRIPMLWDSTENAGFSTAPKDRLYIPQDPDPGRRTVESQEKNETSLLNYVRALLTLRRNHPALGNNGEWKLLSDPDKPYPMIYEREYEGEKCIVVLNPTSKTASAPFPYYKSEDLSVVGGSYNSCTIKKIRRVDTMSISPVSVVIYKVK